jgi:hypothetical protein
MQHLRIARPVTDLHKSEVMYRKGLALRVIGRFTDHSGFDGVMLQGNSKAYHLELTSCRTHPIQPTPTADDLLVFYEPNMQAWEAACARLHSAGWVAVKAFNPYWDLNGKTFEDSDGYRVVLQRASYP